MKNYKFDYPKFEELNPANCRQVSMQIHYPEFCDYLREHYAGQQLCFAEMIYLFYHELEKPPVCRVCGKKTRFIGYVRGYREFCSHQCMNSCKDIQERKKQTSLKNFGTTIPMQCQEVKDKQKQTCQERYGVDNAFQSKELMSKARKTCIERYGVEYANQSEEVRQKIKESKQQWVKSKYKGIISIEPGDGVDIYTMKCPDEKCTKCTEKCFQIGSNTLYDRTKLGADICTKRSPIGAHIKNTTLELFVQNLLNEHNIVYETNNRKILSGKELDIYIPSKRIAIECNGIYWHAMYDSKYHYEKWKACKEQGIQLLSIWEDWIVNKPEIVKSIILSKLNVYEQSIGARECKISTKVKSNEARQFLDTNHIQGFCNSTYKYGLYYEDELVALMLFSKENNASSKKSTGWTLQRFCNKLNTHVVGGAQRLLTHFCKDHPEGDIISFASHDISNGGLYDKLGFEYVNESQANYWYVHNQTHQRFHRSSFMKKDLVRKGYDASLTEEQIMMTTDYLRIFDSGQSKYVLYRN